MAMVPPELTTVLPVPVPVELMVPPDQLRVPLTVKVPLPSRAPLVRALVPLRVTWAELGEPVVPATTVAPSTDTPPVKLAPSPSVNVPFVSDTVPEPLAPNEPTAEVGSPVSCSVPAGAPTDPPLRNPGATRE